MVNHPTAKAGGSRRRECLAIMDWRPRERSWVSKPVASEEIKRTLPPIRGKERTAQGSVEVERMVQERTWEEFRETGLLWFMNTILHLFGWAIVYELDDNDRVKRVYPARVRFRGFSDDINTEGYRRVSAYMRDNADTLSDESSR